MKHFGEMVLWGTLCSSRLESHPTASAERDLQLDCIDECIRILDDIGYTLDEARTTKPVNLQRCTQC